MSMRIPEIVTRVSYRNGEYTPSEIADYIAQAGGEGFGDESKVKALREEAQSEFQGIVEKYGLSMDQKLQMETSEAGKTLSTLLSKHSSGIITLIREGAIRRGVWI